jgi:hypothetical protein
MWKVIHPSSGGNCTIRFGNGLDSLDSSFITLFPLDGSGDDSQGTFHCGRDPTHLEHKDVYFPTDFTCDDCTLQWIWQTETGPIYQCSDVAIID